MDYNIFLRKDQEIWTFDFLTFLRKLYIVKEDLIKKLPKYQENIDKICKAFLVSFLLKRKHGKLTYLNIQKVRISSDPLAILNRLFLLTTKETKSFKPFWNEKSSNISQGLIKYLGSFEDKNLNHFLT